MAATKSTLRKPRSAYRLIIVLDEEPAPLLALVPVIPYEVEGAPLTKPLPDELPLAGTTSDALHAASRMHSASKANVRISNSFGLKATRPIHPNLRHRIDPDGLLPKATLIL